MTREVGFRIIGPGRRGYSCGGQSPTPTPAPPIEGNPGQHRRRLRRLGLHAPVPQHRRRTSTAVDHFAIEEATDERFALGFGDLTVHEFATDPRGNLAYSSYYAGGLRVMSFGDAAASTRSASSSTRAATTSGASRPSTTRRPAA